MRKEREEKAGFFSRIRGAQVGKSLTAGGSVGCARTSEAGCTVGSRETASSGVTAPDLRRSPDSLRADDETDSLTEAELGVGLHYSNY